MNCLSLLCCFEKQTAGAADQSNKFYANQNPGGQKKENLVSASHTWAAGINDSIISACAILTEI